VKYVLQPLSSKASTIESFFAIFRSFVEARRDRHVMGTYCKNPKGCTGIGFEKLFHTPSAIIKFDNFSVVGG